MREAEGPTAGGQSSLLRWSHTAWPPGAADPEVKAGSAISLFISIYLSTFSTPKLVSLD